MPYQHALERLATKLSGALTGNVAMMSQAMTAPQGRIPFREKMPEATALDWWSKHRNDDIGAKAIALLKPDQIANLDLSLTQHAQRQEALGLPTVTEPGTPAPPPPAAPMPAAPMMPPPPGGPLGGP